jgi:hypothetical protein
MRWRARHRNLVLWGSSAGSAVRDDALRLTRTGPIHRWTRIGALLMVIGLVRVARAVRPRWRPLLAGGALTVAGIVTTGAWDVVLLPGVLLLLFAPLTHATPKARRSEAEHELAVFFHPAQRRFVSQSIALYDKQFPGFLSYCAPGFLTRNAAGDWLIAIRAGPLPRLRASSTAIRVVPGMTLTPRGLSARCRPAARRCSR